MKQVTYMEQDVDETINAMKEETREISRESVNSYRLESPRLIRSTVHARHVWKIVTANILQMRFFAFV